MPLPSSFKEYVLTAVQLVLVVLGGGASLLLIHALLTIPPAPPNSDGFVTGAAYLWGGTALVATLCVTGVGVVLPTVFGGNGVLGFTRHQRTVLKAAASCFGGGVLVAVVAAVTVEFLIAVLVLSLAILLGFLLVTVALCWRFAEVVLAKLNRHRETEATS